jgi:hypothetical protein
MLFFPIHSHSQPPDAGGRPTSRRPECRTIPSHLLCGTPAGVGSPRDFDFQASLFECSADSLDYLLLLGFGNRLVLVRAFPTREGIRVKRVVSLLKTATQNFAWNNGNMVAFAVAHMAAANIFDRPVGTAGHNRLGAIWIDNLRLPRTSLVNDVDLDDVWVVQQGRFLNRIPDAVGSRPCRESIHCP